jgi:hypothetical protein
MTKRANYRNIVENNGYIEASVLELLLKKFKIKQSELFNVIEEQGDIFICTSKCTIRYDREKPLEKSTRCSVTTCFTPGCNELGHRLRVRE